MPGVSKVEIQLAVRAKYKRMDRVVVLGISGVGQDRSFAVGNVVAVVVDEFEHIRCCADQDAVAQHANP